MRRPNHINTIPQQTWSNRTIAAAIGVGLVHLVFFYGLLTGLSERIVHSLPNIIDVRILDTIEPKAVELPPPPLPDLAQPQVDFVPPPEIRIAAPSTSQAITVEQKIPLKPRPVTPAATVPKPVALPAPAPAKGIMSTHTIPPYPTLSRRLGEEGIVRLKLVVGTNGRVEQAIVEKSSGIERLDDAARDWVAYHWRYRPAMRGGKPVVSETHVNVVFDLKKPR